ncbi:unnamed protein product [Choristocarpus tenellus]
MAPAAIEHGLYSGSTIASMSSGGSGKKLTRPRSFQGVQPVKEAPELAFDLDEFRKRLAAGFSLTKHSRSGKSSPRVIYTVDDGEHFLMAKGKPGGVLGKLTPFGAAEYSLNSLAKVRKGTEKDPEHEDKTGSSPLRMGCATEEELKRGFTLVYLFRTLDFTASSVEEMEYIVTGFRLLVAETVGDTRAAHAQTWVRTG